MQHPFVILGPEYAADLATMKVQRPLQVEHVARGLLPKMALYQEEQARCGVPAALLAALDQREDDASPECAIGQGNRWDRISTNVPRGKGPWPSKIDADLFYIAYDHLNDMEGQPSWTWPLVCFKGEAWNGFGPRDHGIRTGYLWAGTNLYVRGKYVADGQWDAAYVDTQLGIIPVMRRLIALQPDLAFGALPDHDAVAAVTPPAPTPQGVGGGLIIVTISGPHDTRWVQQALNACYLPAADALLVDGSYGRRTREAVRSFQRFNKLTADGLFGPQTDKALTAALAQHQQNTGAAT